MFKIKNATVLDPASGSEFLADIVLQGEKIAGIEKKTHRGKDKSPKLRENVLDGRGCYLSPSFWDLHVHLREPGEEHKETIETGAAAAVAGGFGHIFAMPNTKPAIDNRQTLELVKERAASVHHEVNVEFIAAATTGREGKEPVDVYELARLGAVAFSDDGNPLRDGRILRSLLDETSVLNSFVIDHCELAELAYGGVMHEGRQSRFLGLPGIPRQAEYLAINRNIEILKLTRGRLHLAHVSTKEGVALVREAKKEGLAGRLSAEACAHHFSLTDESVRQLGSQAKVNPPLREREDMEAILEGLADGTIDAIVSDHAPHSDWEKNIGMLEAPFGFVGLETLFPLTMSYAVGAGATGGRLSLMQAIALLTTGPARILGRKPPRVAVGEPANLTLFNPQQEVVFDFFVSKSRNSPFLKLPLRGKILVTIRKGRVVYKSD